MMLEFGGSLAQQPPLSSSHILVLILVLCDGVPKLLNGILLEANSSLHGF